MRSDILILPLQDGTLFIGPADSLNAAAGSLLTDLSPSRSRLRDILARQTDGSLGRAAHAWGVDSLSWRLRRERGLDEHVAYLVETGRLQARLLPLFRDDPRGPREEGPLRIYQLGSGPLKTPSPYTPPPSSSPPPPPLILSRPTPEADGEFPNESAQVATLQQAAEDGTPFCEICEKTKAARAAA